MIAFDANVLSVALCKDVSVAVDPKTNQQIVRPKERIDRLIADLDSRGEQVLIPTPALTEFLVLVGPKAPEYLAVIQDEQRFEIGEFTERAAIEASLAIRKALDARSPDLTSIQNSAKKRDDVAATWAKVNFDRQIVAIAKVRSCSTIYSTDEHIAKHAEKMNIVCIHLADLPLPPDPPQMVLKLELEGSDDTQDETATFSSSTEPNGSRGGFSEDQTRTQATEVEPEGNEAGRSVPPSEVEPPQPPSL